MKIRLTAVAILLILVLGGWFVYSSEKEGSNYNFKYGLDLQGGTHLMYRADVSGIVDGDINGALDSLKETIERRINIFGVSEPLVQTEVGGRLETDKYRLIVELPGVTDTTEAIRLIGQTPLLEFRLLDSNKSLELLELEQSGEKTIDELLLDVPINDLYVPTGLTGGLLERAQLQFVPPTNEPVVSLSFNSEGRELFSEITKNNIGEILAIFLDGTPVSTPVINSHIADGKAQISGAFSPEEARLLVRDLNFGALPVPIELIETQTVGPTLGKETLNKGAYALVIGFTLITIFLAIWYRLPGLIAGVSLIGYLIIMLMLFKLIPVTLTSSGIAGLILSLGMAVDANVLIFERMREELRGGASPYNAINTGVKRAWSSIRDGNLSSLISAVILYWFAGAAIVKGFALVFAIGVIVSMFTAIFVTKTFALAVSPNRKGKMKWLFNSGFSNKNK
jgi:protein-export membrane protein SecD